MVKIRHPAYHPGDSILHKAKTRNKILLALTFIIFSGTGNGLALLIIGFLCYLGILISGISFLDAWKRLAELKFFLLVLGGIPLFFTQGTPIHSSDDFVILITREGFESSVFTVSKLAFMIWISMILTSTTSPESLMKTVTEFGSKLNPENKFLKEFVLVGALAFQTLPFLFEEAEKEIKEVWGRRSKLRKKGNLLEIAKETVRSVSIWTVEVLAVPDRLVNRYKRTVINSIKS